VDIQIWSEHVKVKQQLRPPDIIIKYSEHYLPFENKNLKSFAVFLAQQTLTKTSIDKPSVIIDVKKDILYFVELLHVCKQHHPIKKITRNRLLNSCNCTFLKQINWFSQNIAV
jgi:hypothetical protein